MFRAQPRQSGERRDVGALRADGPPLDLGEAACGDVVAARLWAKPLLAVVTATSVAARDAELILIAAGLHVSSGVGPSGLHDVLRFVETLNPGSEGQTELSRSPMQFVQFVAAEVADMDPASLAAAIEHCRRALSRTIRKTERNRL
jgi:hypothetical protein